MHVNTQLINMVICGCCCCQFNDTKHRLIALQADFKALQDSYESLEVSKSDIKTEQELQLQQLTEKCEKLENNLTMINKEFESKEHLLEKQMESFQSALDQSDIELAKCEAKLKVTEQLVFELEKSKTMASTINSQQLQLVVHKERAEVTSSLEDITNIDGVELKVPLAPISLKVLI